MYKALKHDDEQAVKDREAEMERYRQKYLEERNRQIIQKQIEEEERKERERHEMRKLHAQAERERQCSIDRMNADFDQWMKKH